MPEEASGPIVTGRDVTPVGQTDFVKGRDNTPFVQTNFDYGPLIAQWEHRQWENFNAQVVAATSSSNDAGVLGNFPQQGDIDQVSSQLLNERKWSEFLLQELSSSEERETSQRKVIADL